MLINETKIRQIIRRALLKEEEIMFKSDKLSNEEDKLVKVLARTFDNNWKSGADQTEDYRNFVTARNELERAVKDGQWNNARAQARKLDSMRSLPKAKGADSPLFKDTTQLFQGSMLFEPMIDKMEAIVQGGGGIAKKPKPGKRQGERRRKLSNAKIKKIQELLNQLTFTDYSGAQLEKDGRWGKRTRSATSKALKSINDEDMFQILGFDNIKDDPLFSRLNTTRKSGNGSWNKLALKLYPEVKNKYDATIKILEEMIRNNTEEDPKKPKPSPPEADTNFNQNFLKLIAELSKLHTHDYLKSNGKLSPYVAKSDDATHAPGTRLDFIPLESADGEFNLANPDVVGSTGTSYSIVEGSRSFESLKAAANSYLIGPGPRYKTKDMSMFDDFSIDFNEKLKFVLEPSPKNRARSVEIEGVTIPLKIFEVVLDGTVIDNARVSNYVILPHLPKGFEWSTSLDIEVWKKNCTLSVVQLDSSPSGFEARLKRKMELMKKRKPLKK